MNLKRIIKKRQRQARAFERAALPERPFHGPGPAYLVHPSVTTACAPSLRAIAAALREESVAIDEEGLRAASAFITRGDSPFFDRDTTAAQSEAERLCDLVFRVETVVPQEQSLNIAV